jgi:antitoxin component of MazEF toxin-antitoxin module
MKAQIVKLGNSLAIRIPKPLRKQAKLKKGDWLEIEAVGEGHVRLRRPDDVPTLAELVAQITPENRYPEI